MMMRMRRQATLGEVDAPAIEQLATSRDSDEHSRIAILDDADGRGSLHLPFRHALPPAVA